MNQAQQITKHFRDVHFGGNWTSVNLKQSLSDVTWEQATTKVDSLNTIAALVFHINYYISAVSNVLKGTPLDAHDKYSFDLPPVTSEEDWTKMLDKSWSDAEQLTSLIEQLPDEKLFEIFVVEKYGNYLRNLMGLIEHTHYHLGQIVVIKKMVLAQVSNEKT
jgi:uncharacterized damage-inducible protein DinB